MSPTLTNSHISSHMSSMNTLILLMKTFLISSGIISIAMAIKFSLPIAMNEIPEKWSIIMSYMKPPYLYIIINAIIITIAASSRFNQNRTVRSDHLISIKTPPPSDYATLPPAALEDDRAVEIEHVVANGGEHDREIDDKFVVDDEDDGEDVLVDSILTYSLPPQEIISAELHRLECEYPLPVREKTLISSRFGRRKPIGTGSEGVRSFRVTKQDKHETLESTWKMITEGRHVPLTRHLNKSDTWEHHGRHLTPARDHVPKSETFKGRSSKIESPPSSSLRKEPSLSQDELNRRVETFIQKFNEDMKMQRQESLDQYMEMISRGV